MKTVVTRRIVMLLLLLVPVLGCAQSKRLTILHTNDMHAAFLPHEAAWIKTDPKPMVGGFKELKFTIDSIRALQGASTLLLDAGDLMTGSPISECEYKGAIGGGLFEMLNPLGYDVFTIGNHELDISQENLRKLTALLRFPVVSANLIDSTGLFPFYNTEFSIIQRNGLRIGVIGIMSPDLFELTNTNNLVGLQVLDPIETTARLIETLDPKTDVIIALTHQGVDKDSLLAAATTGIDVIIGGHSHTRLKEPKIVNGVIIAQAGSNCENLGVLDITVENDSVTAYNGRLLQLWVHDNHPKQEITQLIDSFAVEIDKEYSEVLGTLEVDWKRSGSTESNIGNFVADAMREASGTHVAFTNSSGIRKEHPAGAIRKLDLFEISPFRNYLTTFDVSGAELRGIAQRYADSLARGRSAIQTSGLACTWRKTPAGLAEIVSLTVGGEEVQPEKIYTCSTSDFFLTQAEKYIGMTPASSASSAHTIFEALVDKVRREKNIASQIENRFSEVH